MTSTKQIFKDLYEDYHQILGSSTNLIEAIKERDKRIKDLELQLETINESKSSWKPLKNHSKTTQKRLKMTTQTPTDLKNLVFYQLETYTRKMTKEDILKSFISFLPQSQIEELKDSLERDIF